MSTATDVWFELDADVRELEQLGLPRLDLDDQELELLCDMAAINATPWLDELHVRLEQRYPDRPLTVDRLLRVAFRLSMGDQQREVAQRLGVSHQRVQQLVADLRKVLDQP